MVQVRPQNLIRFGGSSDRDGSDSDSELNAVQAQFSQTLVHTQNLMCFGSESELDAVLTILPDPDQIWPQNCMQFGHHFIKLILGSNSELDVVQFRF